MVQLLLQMKNRFKHLLTRNKKRARTRKKWKTCPKTWEREKKTSEKWPDVQVTVTFKKASSCTGWAKDQPHSNGRSQPGAFIALGSTAGVSKPELGIPTKASKWNASAGRGLGIGFELLALAALGAVVEQSCRSSMGFETSRLHSANSKSPAPKQRKVPNAVMTGCKDYRISNQNASTILNHIIQGPLRLLQTIVSSNSCFGFTTIIMLDQINKLWYANQLKALPIRPDSKRDSPCCKQFLGKVSRPDLALSCCSQSNVYVVVMLWSIFSLYEFVVLWRKQSLL